MRNIANFFKEDPISGIKIVLGSAAIVGMVAGATGHGPWKETMSYERHQTGSDLHFAVPEQDPGAMRQEWLTTKVRDIVKGDDNYSATRFATTRGLTAPQLERMATRSPPGQRGIFDIPGVDKDFAQNAHDTVDKADSNLKPNDWIASRDTFGGDRRSNYTARTQYHERQAEVAFVAGDMKTAHAEAASALRGVSIMATNGMKHLREVERDNSVISLKSHDER